MTHRTHCDHETSIEFSFSQIDRLFKGNVGLPWIRPALHVGLLGDSRL